MKPVKFVIGIDSSLRNTAFTVLDNTGKLIECDNLATKAGTLLHDTIDDVVRRFFDRMEPYLTPELIKSRGVAFFIEDIVYSRIGDKTHGRAELIGTIKWLLRQEGVNVFGVAVKAANSFLDGRFGHHSTTRNSKQQKFHTMQVLHRSCNFYTKNDNIADSYVMALYGYAMAIERQRLSILAMSKIVY